MCPLVSHRVKHYFSTSQRLDRLSHTRSCKWFVSGGRAFWFGNGYRWEKEHQQPYSQFLKTCRPTNEKIGEKHVEQKLRMLGKNCREKLRSMKTPKKNPKQTVVRWNSLEFRRYKNTSCWGQTL